MKNTHIISIWIIVPCVYIPLAHAADDNTWDIGGYIMLDSDKFSDLFNEDSDESSTYFNESELRRARLRFKYTYDKNWSTKLQFNLKDDDSEFKPEIKDAYLTYKGWQNVGIRVGQQKEPFGLENQMSSRNLSTIERSISSDAIAPDRAIGIKLDGDLSAAYWSLGLFSSDDDGAPKSLTGRVIYQPLQRKKSHWHIGASFSERNLNGDAIRINNTLEVHSADSFVEGDTIDAQHMRLSGVESLLTHHGFSVMGEWLNMAVNNGASHSDSIYEERSYQGGYLQLSYMPGGTHRKVKGGLLGAPSKSSGFGNWEVTYRLSEFSLIDEEEKTRSQTIGLNYYPTKKIKFMASYILADLFEDNELSNSGDAISLRAQVSF